MKSVFILGASGFVGNQIQKKFSNESWSVLAPSSKEVNLLKRGNLREYIQNYGAENSIIIANSAITPYRATYHDSYREMKKNLIMAETILNDVKNLNFSKLVYISTIDVYGITDSRINEKTPTSPLSNYAKFKLESEDILLDFAMSNNIPLLVLRLSHVIGHDDNSPKVMNKLISDLLLKNNIELSGKGLSERDFISKQDVSDLIFLLSTGNFEGIFNLATGHSISLAQLAEYLILIHGKGKISYKPQKSEYNYYRFDTSKLNSALQYFSFSNIFDVVSEIYDYKRSLLS